MPREEGPHPALRQWTQCRLMAQGGPMQYPNGGSLYDQEPDLLEAWSLIWQAQEKHQKDEETKAKRKNKSKGKGPR